MSRTKRSDKRAEHDQPEQSKEFIRGYLMGLRFSIGYFDKGLTLEAIREELVSAHNEEADYWGIARVK